VKVMLLCNSYVGMPAPSLILSVEWQLPLRHSAKLAAARCYVSFLSALPPMSLSLAPNGVPTPC
jgi:hypothetical protein